MPCLPYGSRCRLGIDRVALAALPAEASVRARNFEYLDTLIAQEARQFGRVGTGAFDVDLAEFPFALHPSQHRWPHLGMRRRRRAFLASGALWPVDSINDTVLAMGDPLRLGHVSFVVLGVTAARGPTTSYQLKRYVAESIGYFWPLQHASLYREPRRLESLGLLRVEVEPTGRRRQFFVITEDGLEALRAWLTGPVDQPPELRDEALLKLHFGQLVDPSAVRDLAEAQLMERKARLALFTDLAKRYENWPDHRYPLETLRAGQVFERAFVSFWREIANSAEELAQES